MKQLVDGNPTHSAARMNLAEELVRQNDLPNAIHVVEALASETPQLWWIWEKLGELKARANKFPEAAAHFRDAAERKPNDPSLLYKWSRATFDSGAPADAKVILDEAARLAPGHEAILGLYAEIHEQGSDWTNLARIAESWLQTHPHNPLPWMFAARSQWETGYLTQAIQNYRTFLDRGGRNADNLATFGRLCLTALAYDEAARALDEAENLDAECGHMLSAQATLSTFRGRFEEALRYARRAIEVNPQDAAAFKVLVQVSGGHVDEEEFTMLGRLSENGNVQLQDRITASFALADCFDARDDVAAAFAAYERANKLGAERARREGLSYDPAERALQIDWLISAFRGNPSMIHTRGRPQPIFIVGMPRSGTTLIESILGAHSTVFACGERQAMRSIMQEFVSLAPERGMSGVAEATRERWREAFFRELPDLRGAIAVTDKNPWNFDALGMVFELFPDARVIHVCRDPVETGLSIFRNEFPKFASFANRLDDIGHYYGQYAKLMAHWQAVLPDRFTTLQYEDLVTDFSGVAPELLRSCGLEWEESCRNFSAGDRVIGTMSAVQARQPVSVFNGRGDRYARYLSPLIDALRDAGVDPQSGAIAPER
jgi:tetratricopeptide (TPR) repeat protein